MHAINNKTQKVRAEAISAPDDHETIAKEKRFIEYAVARWGAYLDAGVRMVPIEVSSPDLVRAYGLLSSTVTAVYLHHFKDHTTQKDDSNG